VTYKVVDKTLLVVRYGDVNKVHEAREGEKKPRKIAAFDLVWEFRSFLGVGLTRSRTLL